MTLERARELLQHQVDFGSGYNRNAAKLILHEIQKDHGQAGVDQLIRDLDLETVFGFKPGKKITV